MEFSQLLAELKNTSEEYGKETLDNEAATIKFCQIVCKVAENLEKHIKKYENQVMGLWVIFGYVTELYPKLEKGNATNSLCQELFGVSARIVLDVQWGQLDVEQPYKNNLGNTLTAFHQVLSQTQGNGRFSVIISLMETHWAHPVLGQVMSSEEDDEDGEGLKYICEEDPDILRLRVEMMLQQNCEEFALNLCTWCLKHPDLKSDLDIRQIQLTLMDKLHNLDRLQEEADTISPRECISLIKRFLKLPNLKQLSIILTQTFVVQNWIKPGNEEETVELLKLWIEHQYMVDQDEEKFICNSWAIAKLSCTTEQITIIIDCIREKCGDSLLQFYTDMCVYAINIDKSVLEKSIQNGNMADIQTHQQDMSLTCSKLADIFRKHNQKTARISVVTAFSLNPSQKSLDKVIALYKSDVIDTDQDTDGPCCGNCTFKQGECTQISTDNEKKEKINPASLYEVERLLNMLRPYNLKPEMDWKELGPACTNYLQERQRIFALMEEAEEKKKAQPNQPSHQQLAASLRQKLLITSGHNKQQPQTAPKPPQPSPPPMSQPESKSERGVMGYSTNLQQVVENLQKRLGKSPSSLNSLGKVRPRTAQSINLANNAVNVVNNMNSANMLPTASQILAKKKSDGEAIRFRTSQQIAATIQQTFLRKTDNEYEKSSEKVHAHNYDQNPPNANHPSSVSSSVVKQLGNNPSVQQTNYQNMMSKQHLLYNQLIGNSQVNNPQTFTNPTQTLNIRPTLPKQQYYVNNQTRLNTSVQNVLPQPVSRQARMQQTATSTGTYRVGTAQQHEPLTVHQQQTGAVLSGKSTNIRLTAQQLARLQAQINQQTAAVRPVKIPAQQPYINPQSNIQQKLPSTQTPRLVQNYAPAQMFQGMNPQQKQQQYQATQPKVSNANQQTMYKQILVNNQSVSHRAPASSVPQTYSVASQPALDTQLHKANIDSQSQRIRGLPISSSTAHQATLALADSTKVKKRPVTASQVQLLAQAEAKGYASGKAVVRILQTHGDNPTQQATNLSPTGTVSNMLQGTPSNSSSQPLQSVSLRAIQPQTASSQHIATSLSQSQQTAQLTTLQSQQLASQSEQNQLRVTQPQSNQSQQPQFRSIQPHTSTSLQLTSQSQQIFQQSLSSKLVPKSSTYGHGYSVNQHPYQQTIPNVTDLTPSQSYSHQAGQASQATEPVSTDLNTLLTVASSNARSSNLPTVAAMPTTTSIFQSLSTSQSSQHHPSIPSDLSSITPTIPQMDSHQFQDLQNQIKASQAQQQISTPTISAQRLQEELNKINQPSYQHSSSNTLNATVSTPIQPTYGVQHVAYSRHKTVSQGFAHPSNHSQAASQPKRPKTNNLPKRSSMTTNAPVAISQPSGLSLQKMLNQTAVSQTVSTFQTNKHESASVLSKPISTATTTPEATPVDEAEEQKKIFVKSLLNASDEILETLAALPETSLINDLLKNANPGDEVHILSDNLEEFSNLLLADSTQDIVAEKVRVEVTEIAEEKQQFTESSTYSSRIPVDPNDSNYLAAQSLHDVQGILIPELHEQYLPAVPDTQVSTEEHSGQDDIKVAIQNIPEALDMTMKKQVTDQVKTSFVEQSAKQEMVSRKCGSVFKCIICCSVFSTLDSLQLHVQRVCRPDEGSSCYDNLKLADSKSNYTGVNAKTIYQCVKCSSICISEREMQNHTKICPRDSSNMLVNSKSMAPRPKADLPSPMPSVLPPTSKGFPSVAKLVARQALEIQKEKDEKMKIKKEKEQQLKRIQAQKVLQKQKELKLKREQEAKKKEPPPPQFNEMTSSSGKTFYKCELCGQTFCSPEGVHDHWPKCWKKNEAKKIKRLVQRRRQSTVENPERIKEIMSDIFETVVGPKDNIEDTGKPKIKEEKENDDSNKPEDTKVNCEREQMETGTKGDSEESEKVSVKETELIHKSKSDTSKDEDEQESQDDKDKDEKDAGKDEDGDEEDHEDNTDTNETRSLRERSGIKAPKYFFSSDSDEDLRMAKKLSQIEAAEKKQLVFPEIELARLKKSSSCLICNARLKDLTIKLQHFSVKHLKIHTHFKGRKGHSFLCHLCKERFNVYTNFVFHLKKHETEILKNIYAMSTEKPSKPSRGRPKSIGMNLQILAARKSIRKHLSPQKKPLPAGIVKVKGKRGRPRKYPLPDNPEKESERESGKPSEDESSKQSSDESSKQSADESSKQSADESSKQSADESSKQSGDESSKQSEDERDARNPTRLRTRKTNVRAAHKQALNKIKNNANGFDILNTLPDFNTDLSSSSHSRSCSPEVEEMKRKTRSRRSTSLLASLKHNADEESSQVEMSEKDTETEISQESSQDEVTLTDLEADITTDSETGTLVSTDQDTVDQKSSNKSSLTEELSQGSWSECSDKVEDAAQKGPSFMSSFLSFLGDRSEITEPGQTIKNHKESQPSTATAVGKSDFKDINDYKGAIFKPSIEQSQKVGKTLRHSIEGDTRRIDDEGSRISGSRRLSESELLSQHGHLLDNCELRIVLQKLPDSLTKSVLAEESSEEQVATSKDMSDSDGIYLRAGADVAIEVIELGEEPLGMASDEAIHKFTNQLLKNSEQIICIQSSSTYEQPNSEASAPEADTKPSTPGKDEAVEVLVMNRTSTSNLISSFLQTETVKSSDQVTANIETQKRKAEGELDEIPAKKSSTDLYLQYDGNPEQTSGNIEIDSTDSLNAEDTLDSKQNSPLSIETGHVTVDGSLTKCLVLKACTPPDGEPHDDQSRSDIIIIENTDSPVDITVDPGSMEEIPVAETKVEIIVDNVREIIEGAKISVVSDARNIHGRTLQISEFTLMNMSTEGIQILQEGNEGNVYNKDEQLPSAISMTASVHTVVTEEQKNEGEEPVGNVLLEIQSISGKFETQENKTLTEPTAVHIVMDELQLSFGQQNEEVITSFKGFETEEREPNNLDITNDSESTNLNHQVISHMENLETNKSVTCDPELPETTEKISVEEPHPTKMTHFETSAKLHQTRTGTNTEEFIECSPVIQEDTCSPESAIAIEQPTASSISDMKMSEGCTNKPTSTADSSVTEKYNLSEQNVSSNQTLTSSTDLQSSKQSSLEEPETSPTEIPLEQSETTVIIEEVKVTPDANKDKVTDKDANLLIKQDESISIDIERLEIKSSDDQTVTKGTNVVSNSEEKIVTNVDSTENGETELKQITRKQCDNVGKPDSAVIDSDVEMEIKSTQDISTKADSPKLESKASLVTEFNSSATIKPSNKEIDIKNAEDHLDISVVRIGATIAKDTDAKRMQDTNDDDAYISPKYLYKTSGRTRKSSKDQPSVSESKDESGVEKPMTNAITNTKKDEQKMKHESPRIANKKPETQTVPTKEIEQRDLKKKAESKTTTSSRRVTSLKIVDYSESDSESSKDSNPNNDHVIVDSKTDNLCNENVTEISLEGSSSTSNDKDSKVPEKESEKDFKSDPGNYLSFTSEYPGKSNIIGYTSLSSESKCEKDKESKLGGKMIDIIAPSSIFKTEYIHRIPQVGSTVISESGNKFKVVNVRISKPAELSPALETSPEIGVRSGLIQSLREQIQVEPFQWDDDTDEDEKGKGKNERSSQEQQSQSGKFAFTWNVSDSSSGDSPTKCKIVPSRPDVTNTKQVVSGTPDEDACKKINPSQTSTSKVNVPARVSSSSQTGSTQTSLRPVREMIKTTQQMPVNTLKGLAGKIVSCGVKTSDSAKMAKKKESNTFTELNKKSSVTQQSVESEKKVSSQTSSLLQTNSQKTNPKSDSHSSKTDTDVNKNVSVSQTSVQNNIEIYEKKDNSSSRQEKNLNETCHTQTRTKCRTRSSSKPLPGTRSTEQSRSSHRLTPSKYRHPSPTNSLSSPLKKAFRQLRYKETVSKHGDNRLTSSHKNIALQLQSVKKQVSYKTEETVIHRKAKSHSVDEKSTVHSNVNSEKGSKSMDYNKCLKRENDDDLSSGDKKYKSTVEESSSSTSATGTPSPIRRSKRRLERLHRKLCCDEDHALQKRRKLNETNCHHGPSSSCSSCIHGRKSETPLPAVVRRATNYRRHSYQDIKKCSSNPEVRRSLQPQQPKTISMIRVECDSVVKPSHQTMATKLAGNYKSKHGDQDNMNKWKFRQRNKNKKYPYTYTRARDKE